jgi:hypothetical protein
MFQRSFVSNWEFQTPQEALEAGQTDATLPDVDTAEHYLNAVQSILNRTGQGDSSGSGIELLIAAEYDQLKKFGPQVGFGPGWAIVPEKVQKQPQVRRIDARVWRYIGELVNPTISKYIDAPRPVKEGTNHGFPSWRSSRVDHVAHFSIAAEIMLHDTPQHEDQILQHLHGLFDDRLVGDELHVPLTMLSRTGPLAKPLPFYEFQGGRIFEAGESLGHFPRRRQVRAVPTFWNETIRSWALATIDAMKNGSIAGAFTWKHKSRGETALQIAEARRACMRSGKAFIYSDDASNFDDSVHYIHLKDMYDMLAWPDGPKRRAMRMTSAPILGAPLFSGEDAFLYSRKGTVASGTITTTLEGSLINFASVVEAVAASSGWGIEKTIQFHQSGRWFVKIQGDDVLLVLPQDIDFDTYRATSNELGFTKNIEKFPIFLQTWYNNVTDFHNLAGRAIMMSMSRERRAAGPATELFGMAIRMELALGDPMLGEFWAAFQPLCPLLYTFGVKTIPELISIASSPAVIGMMEREVESTPQGRQLFNDFIEARRYAFSGPITENRVLQAALRELLVNRLGAVNDLQVRQEDFSALLDEASLFDWRAYVGSLEQ